MKLFELLGDAGGVACIFALLWLGMVIMHGVTG